MPSDSTILGILWVITAGVMMFYRLDKKIYNKIVADLDRKIDEGWTGAPVETRDSSVENILEIIVRIVNCSFQ